MNEFPPQLQLSIISGLSGAATGLYTFLTDEYWLKLASALATWGALITMLLAWASYLYKIRKDKIKDKL